MSVQVALLVGALSVVDRLIRDRASAALRHGLWMLVVVKLLLPVDLLSPTAVAYWVAPWLASPEVRTAGVPAELETVEAVVPSGSPSLEPKAPSATPLRPRFELTGAMLLTWMTGAGVWGLLVLVRSRAVARRVRESAEAPEALQALLNETAAELGMRVSPPRLRLTETAQGPALCGLLRPVIVLPRGLGEQVEPQALRQVLQHELIHLQRRDLVWNLLQVCVQIAWWWNPLVWIANARIRALREAAVDEAVMLEPGSDDYPATLVAVARHCAAPSRMPMAFLGILESGGRLEARVRRLLDRPLPRNARLGWVGWVTVLLAGVVFLPMGFARRVETLAPPALASKAPADPNANPAGGSTASLKPVSAVPSASNTALPAESSAPNGLRAALAPAASPIDATPQVLIEGRFVEIRGSLPPELVGVLSSNRGSVRLTAAATRDLIKVFHERPGIDVLATPRVTTLSNRGAEVSVSDVRAMIDGKIPPSLVPFATDPNPSSNRTVSAGPTLQVIPDVSNPAIELSVFASMLQVHGDGADSNGASEPVVRTNLVWARERSWIWDGQSVLIDAGALTNRVRFVDKVVHLGDLPLVGRFFRKESTQDQVSRLFVLVTPTLVDAAGRPVHDPAHPPFDPATFPQKP
jgi:beta-lactamase regulating signal transducer with metallopeptidase domain